jgi:hypothetical protein
VPYYTNSKPLKKDIKNIHSTYHGCHYDTKVKPKAATAVIELLMMGGKKRPKHVEL